MLAALSLSFLGWFADSLYGAVDSHLRWLLTDTRPPAGGLWTLLLAGPFLLVLIVLIVSWIPPFNVVAPALWFIFGAWMMAVQYVDYPMDNHMTPFADLKEVLRERRLSSLGFGGIVALIAGIPVLNFFVVPSAVVGATLLWSKELRNRY